MESSYLNDKFSTLLLSLGYQVLSEHNCGKQMIADLSPDNLPHIVLIDVVGLETAAAVETTAWLREHYPLIKVIALCIDAVDFLVKPVLDSGAAGHISLFESADKIQDIIWDVHTKGFYVPCRKHHVFPAGK